jgi:hypothetical protein
MPSRPRTSPLTCSRATLVPSPSIASEFGIPVQVDGCASTAPIFGPGRGVLSWCCSGPRQTQQRYVATVKRAGVFVWCDRLRQAQAIRSGGSPMIDVAYQCHNCGSVHEAESIRQNLILDLRSAASYELSGQDRVLNPRVRFLRWRMARSLARALWPRYSHDPRMAWGRRLTPEPTAQLSDRPNQCRAAPGGSDARAGDQASASPGGRHAGISVGGSTSAPRSDHDQPVWLPPSNQVERRASGGHA